tara:strand:+ start:232 stop:1098 length:867 start_codon:yes stop_codon:yes gene_type:complete
MLFKFAKLIYFILLFLDKIISLFAKKFEFLLYLKEYIEIKSYKTINIQNEKIKFFVPNKAVNLRVKRFYTKEPGTLEWIDNFDINNEIIFWDIGANIGLFSIYASIKHKKINVYSFEPSTSNLRTLSRNISINNLQEKIVINQFPLNLKPNNYQVLKETRFQEGCASNSFGEDFGFDGNKIYEMNSYYLFGNSINNLLENKILEIPNYIKIDVDGIEHLILEGANKFLNSDILKSMSVEINEDFIDQKIRVQKILLDNNFLFVSKNKSEDNPGSKNKSTYNYIFKKKV